MNLAQPLLKAVEAMMSAADNHSCLGMAEDKEYAHDSIYRALAIDVERYFEACLHILRLIGGMQSGYLVLDDVVLARWQSGMLELPKLKDPSEGRYVYGLCAVVLMWTNGRVRIPIAFKPYWGDEKSKLDLAIELIEWAYGKKIRPLAVLFDAWYASQELLRKVHALGWSFVTRLRKNRVLDGVQVKWHGTPYWDKVGKLRGLGFLVKVIRRGDRYFATNALKLSTKQALDAYRIRPQIEEVFRGLQQELGWQGHRHHKRKPLETHLALGLLAYALIELSRGKLSFYQYRRKLISGKLKPDLSPLACDLPMAA
jgi:hypothetical protein